MDYFKNKSERIWAQIALTAFFIGIILIIWVFVSAENANAQIDKGESKLSVTAADTSGWFDLSLGNYVGNLAAQLIILNVSAAATESLQVIVMHSNEDAQVDRKNHERVLGYFTMAADIADSNYLDSTYITGAGCVGTSYWFYAPSEGEVLYLEIKDPPDVTAVGDSTYFRLYLRENISYAGKYVRFIATPTGGTWTFRYEVITHK